jgi:hypothetical protein
MSEAYLDNIERTQDVDPNEQDIVGINMEQLTRIETSGSRRCEASPTQLKDVRITFMSHEVKSAIA